MNPEKDQEFLRQAIELGRTGMLAGKGGPFGAIVVHDGRVIGSGCNEVLAGNDPTAHAEVNAIRDACRRKQDFHLAGAVLYTSCEPCPMCLGAAYWAHISRVVFAATRDDASSVAGFDDARFYLEVMTPWQDRQMAHMMLLREEGVALFREWAAIDDKRLY